MNKATRLGVAMGILTLLAVRNSIAQVQTYCTNLGGNIACTSYDHGASTQSYCSSIGGNLSCTTYGDDTSRVQVRQDYAAGQVIGSAIGYAVVATIEEYRAHKQINQDKKDEWSQFVQDTLSTVQLDCETDPKHETPPIACRTITHIINQFMHLHQKDFPPDARNFHLLANALEDASDDESTWTEQTIEAAFKKIDKKQLDKTVYLGTDHRTKAW
jgi:hypothetical protein